MKSAFSCVALLLLASGAAAQQPNPDIRSAVADAKAGRTDAAIRKLRSVLAAHPEPAVEGQAALELARIHQRQGDWLAAAEQFARLRKLAPSDPEYAYQLGVAWRNVSRECLLRMQSAAPAAARVKQLEAEQLAVTGDVAKAVRRYKEAIAADPALRGAHLGLAMLLARSGRSEEALRELDAELAVAPASAVARAMKQSLEGARK